MYTSPSYICTVDEGALRICKPHAAVNSIATVGESLRKGGPNKGPRVKGKRCTGIARETRSSVIHDRDRGVQ